MGTIELTKNNMIGKMMDNNPENIIVVQTTKNESDQKTDQKVHKKRKRRTLGQDDEVKHIIGNAAKKSKRESTENENIHDLFESKFKLESWGPECKEKIRRLGKNIGELEEDTRLPAGWSVRLYGKQSKSSSKDFVTPDRKFYVRSHSAIIKYMKLSGVYNEQEIEKTADALKVNTADIEMGEENKDALANNGDEIEDKKRTMDDEKLLQETEDELKQDDYSCDPCGYKTNEVMELIMHKRLF